MSSKILISLSILMFLAGCHNGPQELGKRAGCIMKGTACDDGRDSNDIALSNRLTAMENTLTSLKSQVALLELLINSTEGDVTTLQTLSTTLQDQVDDLLIDMATVQGYNNIVSIVDPCGNHPTKIDEVFLKLSTGRIVSSFSDTAAGLNTRFSLLTDGSFSTTDGTGCSFTVSGGGTSVSPAIEY